MTSGDLETDLQAWGAIAWMLLDAMSKEIGRQTRTAMTEARLVRLAFANQLSPIPKGFAAGDGQCFASATGRVSHIGPADTGLERIALREIQLLSDDLAKDLDHQDSSVPIGQGLYRELKAEKEKWETVEENS